MMSLLPGRALARIIRQKVRTRIAQLPTPPGLAVLLVGDDPASATYVHLKEKACREVGIHFELHTFPASVSTSELIHLVQTLNNRPDIHGILVQLPLPHQDTNAIILAIDPHKDVDGFHPINVQHLLEGKPAMASAVALGIMKLLDATELPLAGRSAAVVSSPLFATPLLYLLKERGVHGVCIPPTTKNLSSTLSPYDIVIPAIGKPHILQGALLKTGAIVIDVGTTRVDGKIVGDVDVTHAEDVLSYASPVPGGVGPMTIAMLLVNVLKAATWRR